MFEEEPGGARPRYLGEPRGAQERVQQRTVEQLADVVPMVQILDIPVPRMGYQLVASLKHLDTPIPGQVIAVPKISSSSFPSLQQQTAEQIIDVPVPRTRGDRGGLQGFSPGRGSSQRTVE